MSDGLTVFAHIPLLQPNWHQLAVFFFFLIVSGLGEEDSLENLHFVSFYIIKNVSDFFLFRAPAAFSVSEVFFLSQMCYCKALRVIELGWCCTSFHDIVVITSNTNA